MLEYTQDMPSNSTGIPYLSTTINIKTINSFIYAPITQEDFNKLTQKISVSKYSILRIRLSIFFVKKETSPTQKYAISYFLLSKLTPINAQQSENTITLNYPVICISKVLWEVSWNNSGSAQSNAVYQGSDISEANNSGQDTLIYSNGYINLPFLSGDSDYLSKTCYADSRNYYSIYYLN